MQLISVQIQIKQSIVVHLFPRQSKNDNKWSKNKNK